MNLDAKSDMPPHWAEETIQDLRKEIRILREAMELVRNYPDFDGDTLMGEVMDYAMRNERHPCFIHIDRTMEKYTK